MNQSPDPKNTGERQQRQQNKTESKQPERKPVQTQAQQRGQGETPAANSPNTKDRSPRQENL